MEKRSEKDKRILRIAITGPESTGKSMLAERLAKHFHTVWVPEYAREYIDKLDRKYEQSDILRIAQGQYKNESRLLEKANKFLFCDTEFLVTKIWSEHAYGSCDPWIQEKFRDHIYDLYLLMDVDIPWQPDPQREHPHRREYFFGLYKSELEKIKCPFFVISGLDENRLMNALEKIRSFFKF